MALIPCPHCGHQISDKAKKCPHCGKKTRKLSYVFHIIFILLIIAVGVLVYILWDSKSSDEANTTETVATVFEEQTIHDEVKVSDIEYETYEDEIQEVEYGTDAYDEVMSDYNYYVKEPVQHVLQSYCDAIVNNDFETLSQLYAPMVERFQGANNEERNKVVDRHRRYDDTFKVHGKRSHIRWDTFEVELMDNGRINAVIVEDYAIDREDKSKYSKFVLEKHFVLNEDYQIVSVWDNQLSRSK